MQPNLYSEVYGLYGGALSPAFGRLPLRDLNILKIQWDLTPSDKGESVHIITAEEQFMAYFEEMLTPFTDIKKLNARFFMIWEDNRFIIEKIANQGKIIKELCNLDIWNDSEKNYVYSQNDNLGRGVTTSINQGKNTDDNKNVNKTIEILDANNKTKAMSTTGASMQNSFIDENQLRFLDDPLRTSIKHNNITQGGQKSEITNLNNTTTTNELTSGGNNKNVGLSTNETYSLNIGNSQLYSDKKMSNDAKDRIEFLNLEIKALRADFWGKFNQLFFK